MSVRFTVYSFNAMTPNEQQQAIERIRSALSGLRPQHIMLVEDDAEDAALTLKALSAHKLSAVWVRSTEEVMRRLKEEPGTWLILLDLRLRASSEDGLDILKALKGTPHKVIVLTGAYTSDGEECKEAMRQGAIAITLKPLTADQIQLMFS